MLHFVTCSYINWSQTGAFRWRGTWLCWHTSTACSSRGTSRDRSLFLEQLRTPSLRRPPVQQDSQLHRDRHHINLKVVGMLIWASQVCRPPVYNEGPHSTSVMSDRMGLDTSEADPQAHQGNYALQVPHLTLSSSRSLTISSAVETVVEDEDAVLRCPWKWRWRSSTVTLLREVGLVKEVLVEPFYLPLTLMWVRRWRSYRQIWCPWETVLTSCIYDVSASDCQMLFIKPCFTIQRGSCAAWCGVITLFRSKHCCPKSRHRLDGCKDGVGARFSRSLWWLMWIVHECIVELYHADVLLLLMFLAMLASAALRLLAHLAPRPESCSACDGKMG